MKPIHSKSSLESQKDSEGHKTGAQAALSPNKPISVSQGVFRGRISVCNSCPRRVSCTSIEYAEVQQILANFRDIMPDELLMNFVPLETIQHAIDFVSGSSLLNLPHYIIDSIEHAELRR